MRRIASSLNRGQDQGWRRQTGEFHRNKLMSARVSNGVAVDRGVSNWVPDLDQFGTGNEDRKIPRFAEFAEFVLRVDPPESRGVARFGLYVLDMALQIAAALPTQHIDQPLLRSKDVPKDEDSGGEDRSAHGAGRGCEHFVPEANRAGGGPRAAPAAQDAAEPPAVARTEPPAERPYPDSAKRGARIVKWASSAWRNRPNVRPLQCSPRARPF
jgi:hypothetical protein